MSDIKREQAAKDLQINILNLRQNMNEKQEGQLKEDVTELKKKDSALVVR